MDVFDEDLLSFWKALHDSKVEYLLIGGYAINFHGYQRFTGDVDIWLNDTIENRKKLRKAFINCGMGDYPIIESMQFVAGWTQFRLNNGLELDILTNMKGLENYSFNECLASASLAEIDGVNIPFLHINQLIENKKVINRPKDQADVQALEEIKKLREEL